MSKLLQRCACGHAVRPATTATCSGHPQPQSSACRSHQMFTSSWEHTSVTRIVNTVCMTGHTRSTRTKVSAAASGARQRRARRPTNAGCRHTRSECADALCQRCSPSSGGDRKVANVWWREMRARTTPVAVRCTCERCICGLCVCRLAGRREGQLAALALR
jgi:hypothetical protein